MVKQTPLESGEGKKVAQSALPLRRLTEVQQVISNYSKCNPFTIMIATKFQEELSLLQEAIVAGNLQLFWAVYNKLCKRLLQYGVVVPGYVQSMYRLRW